MAITRKQTDAKVTAVLVGLVALDDNGLTGALHETRMGQLGALTLVLPQNNTYLAGVNCPKTLLKPPTGWHAPIDPAHDERDRGGGRC
jgi:hypothetical protein